jgi:hypothetical protein
MTYSFGGGYFNSTVSNEPYVTRTMLMSYTANEFNGSSTNISNYQRNPLVMKIPGSGSQATALQGQIFPSGLT